MLSTLAMTIIADDRPGIVQLVADTIASAGGNWLESRLCRLGGQFAGIVRAEIEDSKADALAIALKALEARGLRIQIHTEEAAKQDAVTGTLVTIDLVGHDRPGIVKTITGVLSAHGVNVEEFSSQCVNSPMDGAQLFQARATLLLPPKLTLATLRSELEQIASDLMVDLQLGTPAR